MSAFKFHCLNCRSTSLYMESDPRISWEKDHILRCYTCGWALYGKAAVEEAVKAQYRTHQAKKVPPPKVRKAPLIVETPVATLPPDWESLHKMKQDSRKSKGLCAHLACRRGARASSSYCSRKCCVKNAHYRERKRKEDVGTTPASSRAA
jgi:hypothetical protein